MQSTKLTISNEKQRVDLPSTASLYSSGTTISGTTQGHPLVYHPGLDKMALGEFPRTATDPDALSRVETNPQTVASDVRFSEGLTVPGSEAITIDFGSVGKTLLVSEGPGQLAVYNGGWGNYGKFQGEEFQLRNRGDVQSTYDSLYKLALAFQALMSGAPGALDTLKEIADQLAADQTGAAGMLATIQQHSQQLANVVHLSGTSAGKPITGKLDLTGDASLDFYDSVNDWYVNMSVADGMQLNFRDNQGQSVGFVGLNTGGVSITNADPTIYMSRVGGSSAALSIDGAGNLLVNGKPVGSGVTGGGSTAQTVTLTYVTGVQVTQDGAQTLPANSGTTALLDMTVIEPSGGVRPLWRGSYAVSGGNLTITADAKLKTGDLLSWVEVMPAMGSGGATTSVLEFNYNPAYADDYTAYITPTQAGIYGIVTTSNVTSVQYTYNGTSTTLPVQLKAGDVFKVAISRADSTKGAVVTIQ